MSQYIRFSSDDLKVFEAEILYRAKIIVSRSSSRDAVAARGQAYDDVASELRKANGNVFRTPKQVRTKWASTRQKIMTYYKNGKLPQSKPEADLVKNMAESLRSLLLQPQMNISDTTSTTATSTTSTTTRYINNNGQQQPAAASMPTPASSSSSYYIKLHNGGSSLSSDISDTSIPQCKVRGRNDNQINKIMRRSYGDIKHQHGGGGCVSNKL